MTTPPSEPRYELIMPEEGWGFHVQEFVCEWCGPGRSESVYMNLGDDWLTPEEFALELHRNVRHVWHEDTEEWSQ